MLIALAVFAGNLAGGLLLPFVLPTPTVAVWHAIFGSVDSYLESLTVPHQPLGGFGDWHPMRWLVEWLVLVLPWSASWGYLSYRRSRKPLE